MFLPVSRSSFSCSALNLTKQHQQQQQNQRFYRLLFASSAEVSIFKLLKILKTSPKMTLYELVDIMEKLVTKLSSSDME